MWIESLQKSIDYMEENLLEKISIDEIAEVSHFSSFHFQRTFSILTGCTVSDYLRRRRLTQAGYELQHTEKKIIDIALKYNFESPEAFTKAFRRQHGSSPTQIRKGIGSLSTYNHLVIQVKLKGAEPMNVRIEELDAFQVSGVKREFNMEEENGSIGIRDFWDDSNAEGTTEELRKYNNGPVGDVLGVCFDKSEGKIDYWIAVAHSGEPLQQYESVTLPRSKWAVFEVKGAMPDAMPKAWNRIYSEWFPTSGYEHGGGPEFERYLKGDPYQENYESEIWISVK
ncbi:AraC family transcriptional regulator [Halalkalibacillus halophilus]|uniref:AraC family transcriptional regulator n=1 Tax=Halalkalibacillus halophilus TaxID=392827 RepID=UPI00040AE9B8|nr:AraC family transcriptional regulator [Halalkalibacillus halophilus]